MENGSRYEAKISLGPIRGILKCFNLILSWFWIEGRMTDICFKKTEDSVEQIKDFKKIRVEICLRQQLTNIGELPGIHKVSNSKS